MWEKIKNAFKKYKKYIAAFLAGVFSVITIILRNLFNNRNRTYSNRDDAKRAADALARAESTNSNLDRRLKECDRKFEETASLLQKIRNKNENMES